MRPRVIPRRLPGPGEDDCARRLPGTGEDDCARRSSARSVTNPRATEDVVPAESGVFPPVSLTESGVVTFFIAGTVGEHKDAEAEGATRVVNDFRLIVGAAGVAVSMAVDGMFFLTFGMLRPAVDDPGTVVVVVDRRVVFGIGDPVRDGDDVGDNL